jgi:E1A-binding protein p400
MHFLMPNIFQSHKEFKDWFSNPVTNMIEGNEKFSGDLINRLHSVLRPFLLRRLKKDVEKQLPAKHEHIVMCRLSKRQRFLYDEFISNANTKKTLESGNYLGIANVLMQLRKVCNHPALFEPRPIVSPFDQLEPHLCHVPSLAVRALEKNPLKDVSLENLNLNFVSCECTGMGRLQCEEVNRLHVESKRIVQLSGQPQSVVPTDQSTVSNTGIISNTTSSFLSQNVHMQGAFDVYERAKQERMRKERQERYQFAGYLNELRCNSRPLYGYDLIRCVQVRTTTSACLERSHDPKRYLEYSNALRSMILTPEEREQAMQETITHFVFNIPKARAPPPQLHCSHPNPSIRF